MMEARVPAQLAACQTFSVAMRVLQQWPIMGDFLAAQFLLDLSYSEAFNFRQDNFPAGPGARSGITKCFGKSHDWVRTKAWTFAIRHMHENQDRYLQQYELPFIRLHGLPLALNDIQNCFCETDKLARVAYPEVEGIGDRTNIKQVYNPRRGQLEIPVVPPKWLK